MLFILTIRDLTHDFDIGVETGPMLEVAIAMLHLDLNLIKSATLSVVYINRNTALSISERASPIWTWCNEDPHSEFYSFLRETHGYTWCCNHQCFKRLQPCVAPVRFERHLYDLTLEQYESDFDENDINTVD